MHPTKAIVPSFGVLQVRGRFLAPILVAVVLPMCSCSKTEETPPSETGETISPADGLGRGMVIESGYHLGDPLHPLRVKDPRTGESREICKLGKEWYVGETKGTRNGKYVAVLVHQDYVVANVWNHDRTTYALGIVDLSKGEAAWVRPIVHRDRGAGLYIRTVAASENGSSVAAAGSDGSGAWIHVVNPRKGVSVWEKEIDGSLGFDGVAFSPDGAVVYAAESQGTVYYFDLATGRTLSGWRIREGEETLYGRRAESLAASPDGRFLAAALRSPEQVPSWSRLFGILLGSREPVRQPAGEVCVWNTETEDVVLSHAAEPRAIHRLAFSPDSSFLANHHITGEVIQTWPMPQEAAAGKREPSIFDAVKSNNVKAVEALLAANSRRAHARDGYGRTPLHWAVIAGSEPCARLLIKRAGDFNTTDLGGWTPLHYWASGDGSTKVAQLLLQSGADPRASKGSWPPLHWAARAGQAEATEILIAHGADVNITDGDLQTPLHLAADYGHAAVAKLLTADHANLEARTRYGGNTPLHLAAREGFDQVAGVLLAGGAQVDSRNQYGQTPLFVATDAVELKVARLLLEKGANVNATGGAGRIPLHTAALIGNTELVEMLLARGAEVNARDSFGATPLRLARLNKRTEVEAVLRNHGAKE